MTRSNPAMCPDYLAKVDSSMIFQKTTFDRLFSINRNASNNKSSTHFGFESGGKRFFDVTIAGQPRIEQGMTVIALLKQPNSFDAFGLLGWVDCADGSIACDSAARFLLWFLICGFWTIKFSLTASVLYGVLGGFIVAVMLGSFTFHFLFEFIKTLMVRKALVKVRDHLQAHAK